MSSLSTRMDGAKIRKINTSSNILNILNDQQDLLHYMTLEMASHEIGLNNENIDIWIRKSHFSSFVVSCIYDCYDVKSMCEMNVAYSSYYNYGLVMPN